MILVCLFYDNVEHLPPCVPVLPSPSGRGDPAGGAGASVSVSIPTIPEVRSVTSELCARAPPPNGEEVGSKNNAGMDGPRLGLCGDAERLWAVQTLALSWDSRVRGESELISPFMLEAGA